MSAMTQEEYHAEIVRLTKEIYDEIAEDGCEDFDMLHDRFCEVMPPRVSSHSFIQFKHWHPIVMSLSENKDAYFQAWGSGVELSGYVEAMSCFAQYAMQEDLMNAFQDLAGVWLFIKLRNEEAV